jgi:hypothetical protein
MKPSSRPNSKGKPSSGKKPDSAGKGKKAKKEEVPFESKYPKIDYENLMKVHMVTLSIKLLNFTPKSEMGGIMEISIPENYSFAKVIELINERHAFACKNIRLFAEQKKGENVER